MRLCRIKGLIRKWDSLESRNVPHSLESTGEVSGFKSIRPAVV